MARYWVGKMLNLKKIDLKFISEQDGKPCHKHILNGNEVPGCTSVSGLFQDDGWKFAWPPKLMSEVIWSKAKERSAEMKSIGLTDFDGIMWGWKELADVLKEGKGAWRRKRDRAADSGTEAHKLIEDYIANKEVALGTASPEARHCFDQFLEWEKIYQPEWLGSEIQVGSEKYNFAGILDAVANLSIGLTIIDFKTSKDIKDDYNIQLGGLCICLEEMGVFVKDRAILHLPKEGPYEFRIIKSDLEKDKLAFLVGLEFYRHKNLFMARCKEKI